MKKLLIILVLILMVSTPLFSQEECNCPLPDKKCNPIWSGHSSTDTLYIVYIGIFYNRVTVPYGFMMEAVPVFNKYGTITQWRYDVRYPIPLTKEKADAFIVQLKAEGKCDTFKRPVEIAW